MNETMAEMLDRIFAKYYPDGLIWETPRMCLVVHWDTTHMIGYVDDVVRLPEEKIALLLHAWFPRFEQWQEEQKQ